MSEHIKMLKNPIENVLLFLGIVFSILGGFTLYLAIPNMIWESSHDSLSLVISGSILLSIGISLLYLDLKLTQIML